MWRCYWGFVWHWWLDVGYDDGVFVRKKFLYRGVPMDFIIQETSIPLSLILQNVVARESSVFLHKIIIPSLGLSPGQNEG